MSTISKPDKKGTSEIRLGGELVGTITQSGGLFEYESRDKLLSSKMELGIPLTKNLAVKVLVLYLRSGK